MGKAAYIPNYAIQDYLGWEGDWELWDGIPVSMAPSPGFNHQVGCTGLASEIRSQLRSNTNCKECRVVAEVDWHVNATTVVRPDVLVVCDEVTGKWVEQVPVLVAEFLSPSTRQKDLTSKKALYAQEGVRYYVIGDPDEKALTVLELVNGSYTEMTSEGMELHDGCVVKVDVEAVYG